MSDNILLQSWSALRNHIDRMCIPFWSHLLSWTYHKFGIFLTSEEFEKNSHTLPGDKQWCWDSSNHRKSHRFLLDGSTLLNRIARPHKLFQLSQGYSKLDIFHTYRSSELWSHCRDHSCQKCILFQEHLDKSIHTSYISHWLGEAQLMGHKSLACNQGRSRRGRRQMDTLDIPYLVPRRSFLCHKASLHKSSHYCQSGNKDHMLSICRPLAKFRRTDIRQRHSL